MSDDEMILFILNNDLQDAVEQADADHGRLNFNKENPFEVLSDQQFLKLFRLNKNTCQQLLDELTHVLPIPERRKSALSLRTKLLVTLLFYGHGSYQAVTASSVFAGMHQSSVSRALEEITNALNDEVVVRMWVKFPQNLDELMQRRVQFHNATGIPGGIGVIDCTHIAIVRPPEEEHIYVNRKNYHSLNVQLVCDEKLRIMNVNANFPGSTHDAYIWSQSTISQTMEQIYRRDIHNVFFLLGDSGYPLRPWLLIPIRDPPAGTPQERFNNQFKSTRSIVERCNGVLKNRFRCLLKHRVLHYTPLKAAKITIACIVLHNICITNNIAEPERDEELLNVELGMFQGREQPNLENVAGNPDLAAGRLLREELINNHFN